MVIPTHGRTPALLDETILSVLRQTIPPVQVIVVVDGDRESAAALCVRWPEVRVIDLPGPRGEAAARQAGIEAAASEWVCFVDDDDLWPRRKAEITAAYIAQHPECRAVRGTYLIFASADHPGEELNGQLIDLRAGGLEELEERSAGMRPRNDFSYLDIRGQSLARLLDRNRSVIGTTCVRREILAKIPAVPTGTRPGADHLLACLVATRTEWHLIDQPLMFYRLHGSQDSRNTDPRGVQGILRARAEAWRLCGAFAPSPLATYGPEYRREFRTLIWPLVRAGDMGEAVAAYSEALRLLPRLRDRALLFAPEPIVWRWRNRRHGAPVVRIRRRTT